MIGLVVLGGGLAALLLRQKAAAAAAKEEEDGMRSLSGQLADALPGRLAQWSDAIAAAAMNTSPLEVPPFKWGAVIAAVMDRETRGENRSGDFVARRGGWLQHPDIADVIDVPEDLPDGWSAPKDDQGYVLPGPYAVPKDRAGWGRGLMQLDLGSYPALLWSPQVYGDPPTNVRQGGVHLRELFIRLSSSIPMAERVRRTAAAYNAGPRALTAANPDALTTQGNYGADVLARAASFEANGEAA